MEIMKAKIGDESIDEAVYKWGIMRIYENRVIVWLCAEKVMWSV